MIKRILIILFSSFLGIIGNPEILAASDSVAVTGLDNANIVETVILPEPEPEIIAEEPQATYVEEVYYEPFYYTPVYEKPVYYAPANNIVINGSTIALEYTASTAEDAGAEALAWYYKTGKFL